MCYEAPLFPLRTLSSRAEHPESPPRTLAPMQQKSSSSASSSLPYAEPEEVSQAAADTTIVLHPGVVGLPPLTPPKPVSKFSFHQRYGDDNERNYFGHGEVPNNTPKPKLPMWASSLTHPSLGKLRHPSDNWISLDALGFFDEEPKAELVAWLTEWLSKDTQSLELFQQNVEVHPRVASVRGLFASHSFKAGEILFTVPLSRARPDESPALTLHPSAARSSSTTSSSVLSTEALASSTVNVPSFERVLRHTMSLRRSSLDPTPHLLFVEQVYLAMQVAVACTKKHGDDDHLTKYLRMLHCPVEQLPEVPLFDDDAIEERHRGVLEPNTALEYGDHCLRFRHLLRGLLEMWEAESSSTNSDEVLPSLTTLEWAFRVVLSRQRMVPHLRRHVSDLRDCEAAAVKLDTTEEKDLFSTTVMRCKWRLLEAIGVLDRERLEANDIREPEQLPAIVPLLDLLQHAPGGVANTTIEYERVDDGAGSHSGGVRAVVRAAKDLEMDEELTCLYPKCYSVSYTLYRYGCLPLHRREDDDHHRKP